VHSRRAKAIFFVVLLAIATALLLRPREIPQFLSEGQAPSGLPIPLTLSRETYEDPFIKLMPILARERLGHLPPRQVAEALRLAQGMAVADIGAGVGALTFEIARAVGENGKVDATEVDAQMLKGLVAKRDAEGFRNIEAKLVRPGQFDDFYRGKKYDQVLMVAFRG
jgi:SAM-dependent methyltransferase